MKRIILRGLLATGTFLPCGAAIAQQEADTGNDIIVLGTRSEGRLATKSPAPIDSFSSETLQARGLNDISRVLQFLAPSFNYARSATAPSAANTRAASLRGLAPDQILVLVNGKRWHGSSVVNFNNVIGRGSVPVDLNAIPVSAIARVDILRDGAAAQYGSDAIGGVINITLKSGVDAGFISVQSGLASRGDGATQIATINHGFAIGPNGSLNLTAEIRDRNATNRAGIDSRYNRITTVQGDPDSTDVSFAGSFRQDLGDAELYADGVYNHRRSISAAQYRAPTISPVVYPRGFIPRIRLKLDDIGGTIGIKGDLGGWLWDLSDTIGYSKSDFFVFDTVNTSLGTTGPNQFDAGGARYLQNVAALAVTQPVDLLAGANIAFGAERRDENYHIRSGNPLSFRGAGAQGFPGFNPPTPVDANRHAWSFYLDGELSPFEALELGAAIRHERYSDFGSATTGKLSAFFQPARAIAFRATASTGFRAPSLQQQYFSTVTGQSVAGQLVNVGTFAVTDPVSLALGAEPLRRERSRNMSGGVVLTPGGGFTLTADAFHIEISDRIALSETLGGATVAAVLRAAGITNASQARFFTNALDTTSEGFEVTARWNGKLSPTARLNLAASYARVDHDVDRLATNPALPTAPLLGPVAIALLTTAQPKDKLTMNASLQAGAVTFDANLVRFGEFTAVSVVSPQTYGAETTIDLSAEVRATENFSFSLGVLNLTDAFPDKIADRALSQGGGLLYPEVGALGTNGREFYARATMNF